MQLSPIDEVRQMYEATADAYAQMMDSEIALPIYADVLGRLQQRITHIDGPVIDAACGSGHMLSMYRDTFDRERPLIGVDLSERMVAITQAKLSSNARVVVGDMRFLENIESASCSAVLNFFALHHLDATGVQQALGEWFRVLAPGGQLVVATWEGQGAIDYGEGADIVALRYSSGELKTWANAAGFVVTSCRVEPVEAFPMNALHLEGSK